VSHGLLSAHSAAKPTHRIGLNAGGATIDRHQAFLRLVSSLGTATAATLCSPRRPIVTFGCDYIIARLYHRSDMALADRAPTSSGEGKRQPYPHKSISTTTAQASLMKSITKGWTCSMAQRKACAQSMCPATSASTVSTESRMVVERELTLQGIPATHRHPLTLACMPIPVRLMIGLIKSWLYELLGRLTYRIPSSAALCLPFQATYALTHIPRDPLLRDLAVGGGRRRSPPASPAR
jgi:hypothetical protein